MITRNHRDVSDKWSIQTTLMVGLQNVDRRVVQPLKYLPFGPIPRGREVSACVLSSKVIILIGVINLLVWEFGYKQVVSYDVSRYKWEMKQLCRGESAPFMNQT